MRILTVIIIISLILIISLLSLYQRHTYDYVIVGAGAAGCIVAVRLAEKGYRVALIDSAENFNDNINVETPYNCYLLWDNPDYQPPYDFDEWIFTTANGRKYPRGVGWGGSSNHHAMVATRGKSYIYDIWSEMLNDSSWSYKNVVKYFKKSEKCLFNSCPEKRGKNGWLSISKSEPQYFELELMNNINKYYNIPVIESFNCTDEDGVGFYDFTINDMGRRSHSGVDLLEPALKKGLKIKTIDNSLVTKVIFDKNKKAIGVEYIPKKYVYQASTQNKITKCLVV
jgi:choline dehydrogenase